MPPVGFGAASGSRPLDELLLPISRSSGLPATRALLPACVDLVIDWAPALHEDGMRRLAGSLLVISLCSACSGGEIAPASDAATDAPSDAEAESAADDDARGATQSFVGTWNVAQGSSLVTCPGALMYPSSGMMTSDVGGVVEIRLGASPATIVAAQQGGAGCTFTYRVTGNVAVPTGVQTCVPNGPVQVGCNDDGGVDPGYDGGGHRFDGGGSPYLWTLVSETLTLAPDGAAIVDTFDEELGNYASYCEDNTVVFYDCQAIASGDVWTRR